MAAPKINASKVTGTLSYKTSKESTPKVTKKHLLIGEKSEWPRPSRGVETQILSKLSDTLKTYPGLMNPKLKMDAAEQKRIMSQFTIGNNTVLKGLDRNQFECVLVFGNANPAISVEHVIRSGQEKGCPLLVLDDLGPTFASATNGKIFPLSMGLKKMNGEGKLSVFAEVISLIIKNAPVQSNQQKDSIMALHPGVQKKTGEERIEQNKFHPVKLVPSVEKELLVDLERVLSEAKQVEEMALDSDSAAKKDRKRKKKKQKKKKGLGLANMLNDKARLEIVVNRKAMSYTVQKRALRLVFVSEKMVPILLREPRVTSFLSMAREKGCPVVQITGLTELLKSLFDVNLSMLGIKKRKSDNQRQKHFEPIVDKCLKYLHSLSNTISHEENASSKSLPSNGLLAKPSTERERSQALGNPKENVRLKGSQEDEEEDFSYLYILKSESKDLAEAKAKVSSVIESMNSSASFASDFISLSGLGASAKATNTSSDPATNKLDLKKESKDGNKRENSQISLQQSKPENSKEIGPKEEEERAETEEESGQPDPKCLTVQDKPKNIEMRLPHEHNPDGEKMTSPVNESEDEPRTDSQETESLSSNVNPQSENPNTSLPVSSSVQPNLEPTLVFTSRDGSSSHPAAKKTDRDPQQAEDPSLPLFSLSRAGDSNLSAKKGHNPTKPVATEWRTSSTSAILGMDSLPQSDKKDTEAEDLVAALYNTSASKKAAKRKMKTEEGFLSFAYNETNIQTMTFNPSKKRKKKGKKK